MSARAGLPKVESDEWREARSSPRDCVDLNFDAVSGEIRTPIATAIADSSNPPEKWKPGRLAGHPGSSVPFLDETTIQYVSHRYVKATLCESVGRSWCRRRKANLYSPQVKLRVCYLGNGHAGRGRAVCRL
jgi:hypothetical protein